MRLPALSFIIATLAICWCVAGWWAHGIKILLYPLIWCLIAAGFFIHSRIFPIPTGKSASAAPSPDADTPEGDSQSADSQPEKLAAG